MMNDFELGQERMRSRNGVSFRSARSGYRHDSGWFRMLMIQHARARTAELRSRITPKQRYRIELHVHGQGDRGPLIDRAYGAFVEIALIQPTLNVRETWYIAYRDARRSNSEEWRRLLAAFPTIRYTRTDHD